MLSKRPMVWFASALTAGIAVCRLHPAAAAWTPGVFLAGAVLAAVSFLSGKGNRSGTTPGSLPAGYAPHILPVPGRVASGSLGLFLFAAGVACAALGMWRQDRWRDRMERPFLPETRFFTAELEANEPSRNLMTGEPAAWSLSAVLLKADGEAVEPVGVRLRLPAAGPDFRRGDRIVCRVLSETPRPPSFPGDMDDAFWLERDGLSGGLRAVRERGGRGGAAVYAAKPEENPSAATVLLRGLDALRAAAVRTTLGYERGEAGRLAVAMLYGFRHGVGDDVRDTFRRVGIGHVLAISGLHVGLMAALAWRVCGWLGLGGRRRRAAACLALVLAYLGISGGQVPAVRAGLMASAHLLGIFLGRRGDLMNSLGISAFAISLANPSAPFDLGFQLSFIAVAFIFLGLRGDPGPAVRPPAPGKSPGARLRARLLREARQLTRLSVATWIGLFPLIALSFCQVNPMGLAINIVVIPLMSLALAGGLLLPFLGWLPGARLLLLLPTNAMTLLARLADGVPGSSFPIHPPAAAWAWAFYAAAVLFALRSAAGRMRRPLTGLSVAGAAVAAAVTLLGLRSAPPPPEGRITALPVYGRDVVVAESPEGGIAIIGSPTRSGLREARWLHGVKRGGPAALVRTSSSGGRAYPALAYHQGIAAVSGLDELAEGKDGWRNIPGAPGVRVAAARGGGRNPVRLAVRAGKRTFLFAGDSSSGRRFEMPAGGLSAGDSFAAIAGSGDGRVILSGPGRWRRGHYGAVTLEASLKGYLGGEWADIPADAPERFKE